MQRKIANLAPFWVSSCKLEPASCVHVVCGVSDLTMVGRVVQDADRLEFICQDFRLLGGHTWRVPLYTCHGWEGRPLLTLGNLVKAAADWIRSHTCRYKCFEHLDFVLYVFIVWNSDCVVLIPFVGYMNKLWTLNYHVCTDEPTHPAIVSLAWVAVGASTLHYMYTQWAEDRQAEADMHIICHVHCTLIQSSTPCVQPERWLYTWTAEALSDVMHCSRFYSSSFVNTLPLSNLQWSFCGPLIVVVDFRYT